MKRRNKMQDSTFPEIESWILAVVRSRTLEIRGGNPPGCSGNYGVFSKPVGSDPGFLKQVLGTLERGVINAMCERHCLRKATGDAVLLEDTPEAFAQCALCRLQEQRSPQAYGTARTAACAFVLP